MTVSYSQPGFDSGHAPGPNPQYSYPLAPFNAHQNHLPSSYAQSHTALSTSFPHNANANYPLLGVDYDPTAATPHYASTHDPSLHYDPRTPNILPPRSNFASKNGESEFTASDEQTRPKSVLTTHDDPLKQSSKYNQSTSNIHDKQLSLNVSDDELEEGELSESGSQMSLEDTSGGHVPDARAVVFTDGASDDIAQRSVEDSLLLTRNLITEMYSWGVTFEDMIREVDHPEHLRASFVAAGLPVTTTGEAELQATKSPSITVENSESNNESTIAQVQKFQDLTRQPSEKHATNGETRPLDRKALIAQKLAAKSVAARASPATDATRNASVTGAGLPLKPPTAAPLKAVSQQAGHALVSSSELEAQKRAQTELARRRMEALKQKLAVKDTSSQALQPTSTSRHLRDKSITPPTLQTEIEPAISVPPRKSSYFSPVSQTQMFSIPGLMSAQSSHGEQETQSAPKEFAGTDKLEEAQDDTEVDFQKRSVNVVDPNLSNTTLAEVENVPRAKRPEASDFIDVADLPPPKSHLNGDVGVIIDISEEESDEGEDESDDLVARLRPGNGLGGHGTGFLPASVLHANQSGSERLRPQLTKSTSASVTPKTLSTPKGQEEEELRSKELKIQSLTRKIAEMEAKRQGKKDRPASSDTQSISQAHIAGLSSGSGMQKTSSTHSLPPTLAVDTTADENEVPQQEIPEAASTLQQDVLERPDLGLNALNGKENSGRGNDLTLPNHNASRRKEIELGIPLLDKEIDRARQKLSLLKKQEIDLEVEIQSGLDGKRMLMKELQDILSTAPVPNKSTERSSANEAQRAKVAQDQGSTSPMRQSEPRLNRSDGLGHADVSQTRPVTPPRTQTRSSVSTPQDAGQTIQEFDDFEPEPQNEDVNMDISQSEIDEGEILDQVDDFDAVGEPMHPESDDSDAEGSGPSRPESPLANQQATENVSDASDGYHAGGSDYEIDSEYDPAAKPIIDLEDEEMYEPALDIEPAESMQLESEHGIIENSREPSAVPAFDPLFDEMEMTDEREDAPHQGDSQIDSDSQGSEDEYEPPEPPEPPSTDTNHDNPLHRESPGDVPLDNSVQDPQVDSSKPHEITQAKKSYFTPYESPLKDFKSRNSQPTLPTS